MLYAQRKPETIQFEGPLIADNAKSMSLMGHSRPSRLARVPANVRCYSNSGQTRVRLACPRSAINDHCSMSEGFDHTHFHDARATVEEPSTASLTDIRLAVANKPGSPDSR